MRLLQLLFAGFIAVVAFLAAICGAIILGLWGLLAIARGSRTRKPFPQQQTAGFSTRYVPNGSTGDVIDIVASEVDVARDSSRK